ncbi:enhancer of yellow 2 transcription factor, partial [Tremellales sp. Uapishka_1]
MAATSQPSQALIDQVKARLIQTGEWDRIANVLRAQLEESGFEDDLKDLAKEKVRNQPTPNLEGLMEELAPLIHTLMFSDARETVVQQIEVALERIIEKA